MYLKKKIATLNNLIGNNTKKISRSKPLSKPIQCFQTQNTSTFYDSFSIQIYLWDMYPAKID